MSDARPDADDSPSSPALTSAETCPCPWTWKSGCMAPDPISKNPGWGLVMAVLVCLQLAIPVKVLSPHFWLNAAAPMTGAQGIFMMDVQIGLILLQFVLMGMKGALIGMQVAFALGYTHLVAVTPWYSSCGDNPQCSLSDSVTAAVIAVLVFGPCIWMRLTWAWLAFDWTMINKFWKTQTTSLEEPLVSPVQSKPVQSKPVQPELVQPKSVDPQYGEWPRGWVAMSIQACGGGAPYDWVPQGKMKVALKDASKCSRASKCACCCWQLIFFFVVGSSMVSAAIPMGVGIALEIRNQTALDNKIGTFATHNKTAITASLNKTETVRICMRLNNKTFPGTIFADVLAGDGSALFVSRPAINLAFGFHEAFVAADLLLHLFLVLDKHSKAPYLCPKKDCRTCSFNCCWFSVLFFFVIVCLVVGLFFGVQVSDAPPALLFFSVGLCFVTTLTHSASSMMLWVEVSVLQEKVNRKLLKDEVEELIKLVKPAHVIFKSWEPFLVAHMALGSAAILSGAFVSIAPISHQSWARIPVAMAVTPLPLLTAVVFLQVLTLCSYNGFLHGEALKAYAYEKQQALQRLEWQILGLTFTVRFLKVWFIGHALAIAALYKYVKSL